MEQPKHDKYDRLYASIATAVVKAKDDTDIPMDIVGLVEYYRNLKATEDSISRKIVPWISDHPVYDGYLSHIQGIGPMFAANLIAMLTPITDFPKPSMLVAYAGLAGSHYEQECKHGHKFQTSSVKTKCPININEPGEEVMSCGEPIVSTEFVNRPMKRKKGYHILANARLKTTLFKIASSFEKQSAEKSQYRKLYDVKKMEYLSKLDKTSAGYKGHARLMAMRYIEKRFLVNLHVAWMTGLGYDVTPYEATLENHTIEPIRLDDGHSIPEKKSIKPVTESEVWTIRQLTDSYYDIQKMRIKCFNNIVAWVKSNEDMVTKFIPKHAVVDADDADSDPDEDES